MAKRIPNPAVHCISFEAGEALPISTNWDELGSFVRDLVSRDHEHARKLSPTSFRSHPWSQLEPLEPRPQPAHCVTPGPLKDTEVHRLEVPNANEAFYKIERRDKKEREQIDCIDFRNLIAFRQFPDLAVRAGIGRSHEPNPLARSSLQSLLLATPKPSSREATMLHRYTKKIKLPTETDCIAVTAPVESGQKSSDSHDGVALGVFSVIFRKPYRGDLADPLPQRVSFV